MAKTDSKLKLNSHSLVLRLWPIVLLLVQVIWLTMIHGSQSFNRPDTGTEFKIWAGNSKIHPFSACVSDSTILHVGNQNTWRKPKPAEETCKPHPRTRTMDLLGGKWQRYLSSHHNWKVLGSNSLPCIAPLSKTLNLRLLKASHACIKCIVIHTGLKHLQMTNNQT